MIYQFTKVESPTGFDTGVDIYDCTGGSSGYVVKHDRVHNTISCSCPDSVHRYRSKSRDGHECKHCRLFRRELLVSG